MLYVYSIYQLWYIYKFCHLLSSSSPHIWLQHYENSQLVCWCFTVVFAVFQTVCSVLRGSGAHLPGARSQEPGARSRVIGSGSISVSLSLRYTHKHCSSPAFSLCVAWWHVKLDALASYGTIYIGGEEIYELTDHFLVIWHMFGLLLDRTVEGETGHIERRKDLESGHPRHRMSERCP